MKIIALKDLARTGKFGNIGIGTSQKEVFAELGESDDWYDGGDSQIFKYGWYEFFFWTESMEVFGMQNDHLEADCENHDKMILFENDHFQVDTWFMEVGRSFRLGEVKSILEEEGIGYKQEVMYGGNGPTVLRFDSGVYFDFSNENSLWNEATSSFENEAIEKEDRFLLNGIRLFDV